MSVLDNIVYVPCNPSNHGGTRTKGEIKYLVYHYTGNDGDHDTNNAIYYSRPVSPPASAHYFVDDDSVTQSVPDLTVAWAVGGDKWKDCVKTGGGKLYGVVNNRNSISIEMCDTVRNGELMATEKTLENAIQLGKLLMERYKIPINNVYRHFDVTGKHCPAYFMDNDKWEAFKSRLVEDDMDIDKLIEQITPEQLDRLAAKMSNETAYMLHLMSNEHAASLATPDWMKPELDEAVAAGITDGTRPLATCMRGQAAMMVLREGKDNKAYTDKKIAQMRKELNLPYEEVVK